MTLVSLYKSIFEPITKGGSDKFHFLVPALVCIGRLMQQKQEREITEPAWRQISAAAPRQSFFVNFQLPLFLNFPNPLFLPFHPAAYSQGYPPSFSSEWVKRVHISPKRLCGNNLVFLASQGRCWYMWSAFQRCLVLCASKRTTSEEYTRVDQQRRIMHGRHGFEKSCLLVCNVCI